MRRREGERGGGRGAWGAGGEGRKEKLWLNMEPGVQAEAAARPIVNHRVQSMMFPSWASVFSLGKWD